MITLPFLLECVSNLSNISIATAYKHLTNFRRFTRLGKSIDFCQEVFSERLVLRLNLIEMWFTAGLCRAQHPSNWHNLAICAAPIDTEVCS